MANFNLHLGGGIGYQLNAPVSSSELNLTGIDLTKCANFDEGSAHTPSAPIILTGANGITTDSLKVTSTGQLEYDERTVVRRQPFHGAIFESDEWGWTPGGGVFLAQELVAGSGAWTRFYLTNLPHGGKLSSVTVSWDGAPGHANDPVVGAGPPPFDLVTPELEVWLANQLGGVFMLGSQTDTVTTRALYEESHEITALTSDHVIDLEANAYYVRFRGEYDPDPPNGDYISGGVLEAIKASCKVSAQPEY